MDNPAQSSDLTARGWSGDDTVATTWLGVAWRALRREVPSIEASVASGELTVDDVKDVVVSAALRIVRNPEGYESESGQIDDYQESFKRADASQDVYFTAAELRRLTPVGYVAGGFVGSIKYC